MSASGLADHARDMEVALVWAATLEGGEGGAVMGGTVRKGMKSILVKMMSSFLWKILDSTNASELAPHQLFSTMGSNGWPAP